MPPTTSYMDFTAMSHRELREHLHEGSVLMNDQQYHKPHNSPFRILPEKPLSTVSKTGNLK